MTDARDKEIVPDFDVVLEANVLCDNLIKLECRVDQQKAQFSSKCKLITFNAESILSRYTKQKAAATA